MLGQAITILDDLVAKEPDNYEALWRLGRCWQISGDSTAVKQIVRLLLNRVLAFTERALKANDQGVNGHLWHAVLLGSIAQEKKDLNSLQPGWHLPRRWDFSAGTTIIKRMPKRNWIGWGRGEAFKPSLALLSTASPNNWPTSLHQISWY